MAASTRAPVSTWISDMRNMPTAMTAVPTTTKILYRPRLEINRPDAIEVKSKPTSNGRSRKPESVGLMLRTVCR